MYDLRYYECFIVKLSMCINENNERIKIVRLN